MPAAPADGPVVLAVKRDLASMPDEIAKSSLAASALVMAEGLDGPNSLTSKSMAQGRLQEAMDRLRELAPPAEENDELDDLAARRAKRLAAVGGAGA